MSLKVKDNVIPIIVGGDDDRTTCPVCGMALRMERHTYRYNEDQGMWRPILDTMDQADSLAAVDPKTSKKLKKLRKGKKTVAFVGLAPTSCSLAPFDDPDVEIWCLNEAHAFNQWLTRWDRWFQIHSNKSWQRDIAKRNIRGHFDWLKREHYVMDEEMKKNPTGKTPAWVGMMEHRKEPPWTRLWRRIFHKDEFEHYEHQSKEKLKPIYMQYWHPDVPNSVGYPLYEVCQEVFSNFHRGDKKVKYFTSTFAYMAGIAVLEKFERVEIYGFEFADDIEYVRQKACAEFWIGLMMGRGMDIYTPPNNQILFSSLYGGKETWAGW